MKFPSKLKALFKRKPKVVEEKPLGATEKKPSESGTTESIDEKQRLS